MIGQLPKSLTINGKDLAIQTDYRVVLLAFQIINDDTLDSQQKAYLMLDMFYGINNLEANDYEQALKKLNWFIDGGRDYKTTPTAKVMDWEQDEQFIFSAINKVANREVRELNYLHWWTFLGYFNEIGEGLFSSIVHIRTKKANHKKLSKEEQEFATKNKDLIFIKKKLSQDEQDYIEELNKKLK